MTEALFILAISTVLIVLNGVYVAAEFAVIGVPRLKLEALAREHSWAERLLRTVADASHQDRYIAVCQVGISLASLGLGMYGEHALAQALVPHLEHLGGLAEPTAHTLATAVALLLLTFWHIVAGEMIPKSLALQFPVATARWVDLPMRLSGWLLAPLVWALNHLGNLILRLLGLPVSQDTSFVYSAQEMRLVFDESREEGLLDEGEHELLQRTLSFDERRARDVMVPRTRIVMASESATRQELRELVREHEFSRYPVYRGQRDAVVGMLHVKDLVLHPSASPAELVRPVLYLPEMLRLDRTFERLTSERAHLALLVDERGTVTGMLTQGDVVGELFGKLGDEFDAS